MITDLLFTLLLVFLNAFFVAAEFAIVKVRSSQIDIKAKNGSRAAEVTRGILNNLDAYLSASQLGITIASLALGWVGERVATQFILSIMEKLHFDISIGIVHTIAVGLAFSFITVLHIVIGEQAPKSLAIKTPVKTALALAIPLNIFYIVLRPFIWVLNGLSKSVLKLLGVSSVDHQDIHSSEELQMILDEGKASGALDTTEHELIKNVFTFNDRLVKSIMQPRTKLVAIDIESTIDEIKAIILSEGYSRIPVYNDTIDKIVGVAHAKDLLPLLLQNKNFKLSDIVREAYYIPENKKINDTLNELRKKRTQMAIVLDEFGGTAGIVTVEDILEELVGEIQDEQDEEKPIVEEVNGEYILDATAAINDVNEFIPDPLPESEEYETVGGYMNYLFENIPDEGSTIDTEYYHITVQKANDRYVEEIKLSLKTTKSFDDTSKA